MLYPHKKRLKSVLVYVLVLVLLMGVSVIPASASSAPAEVLNPLANFEPQDNVPLTIRDKFKDENGKLDFNGKYIGVSSYGKVGNAQAVAALGELLKAEFPGVTIVNAANLGSPWNNKTDANYDQWAGVAPINVAGVGEVTLDAVIFGIADCNVCTWWSTYHAKEVESRGGIAAVLTNSTYASTSTYAAVDNGFTQVRRVVVDRKWNAKAYSQAGVDNAACQAYYRDFALVNAPLDPDYASVSMFTGERAFVGAMTPYEQLKWALAGDLTEEDTNPVPITQETYNGALAWDTKTFSSSKEFNSYAMEYKFGDGLPLVAPTAGLVNEMLAGTTRDRNEIIGKMKMRGGVITVEKIAINAVMAGAKPEHLPVLIAAMEAYANGWENDKMWYHNMSTGAYSMGISMLINGPLAKELGIDNDRGFAGSGHEANNLIGRAFRLCVRNIGHNYTPDVDTQNRLGRLNDINLMVFSEQEDELPDGWKPHHVMMGYEPDESTITMIGVYSNVTVYNSEDNTNRWTPQQLMLDTRVHATTTASMVLIPPGAASVMADKTLAGDYYMPSKEAMKEWYATHTTDGAAQTRSAGIYNMTYPIVAGGDPGYIGSMYGFEGLYATLCYQTQLISGATLTAAGKGATVPSTPQNFEIEYGTNDGAIEATLTWEAPLSDGGSPITGYQVNWIDGGNRQYAPWTDVPAGEMSYTVKDILPGTQSFFKVRAVNGIHNASEFVTAAADMNTVRASGRGAWACKIDWAPKYNTVDFLASGDDDADVVYTQIVKDGESIDWDAVKENYTLKEGKTWDDIESWRLVDSDDPIEDLDMPVTEDMALVPVYVHVSDMTINFPGFDKVQVNYWTNGKWTAVGDRNDLYEDSVQFDFTDEGKPKNGKAIIQVLYTGGSATGHYYQTKEIDVSEPGVVVDIPTNTVTVKLGVNGRLALVDGDWVYRYSDVKAGDTVVYNVLDNGKRYEARFIPTGESMMSQHVLGGETISFGIAEEEVFDITINFPGFDKMKVNYWTNGKWTTVGGQYDLYENSVQFNFSDEGKPKNGKAIIQVLYTGGSATGHYYQSAEFDASKPGVVIDIPITTVTVNVNNDGRLALVDGDWIYKYSDVKAGDTVVYNVLDNGRRYEARFVPTGGSTIPQYVFGGGTISFGEPAAPAAAEAPAAEAPAAAEAPEDSEG